MLFCHTTNKASFACLSIYILGHLESNEKWRNLLLLFGCKKEQMQHNYKIKLILD